MKRFETEHTVWVIDEDNKEVTRFPRAEAPVHPNLSYNKMGKTEKYVYYEVVDDHLVVMRASDMHRIESGPFV